ncbi:alpha/beta hydrolase [Paenibacillus sinensis]|uniref:alpha/beta hydrolase n=2 Tax=Paenibacillus TaxID=44249 RepID=UPI001F380F73|nr:alpha/beta hydrolase [Paenibacillus sinensis]
MLSFDAFSEEGEVADLLWMIIAVLAVAVCAGGVTYAGLYFYKVAIFRAPKMFIASTPKAKVKMKEEPPTAGASWGEGQQWIAAQQIRELELTSDDGLKLRGYWIPSERAGGRTAIIAHGYSGKAKDMGAYAKLYHDKLGFNVLLPDARGHGQSEGSYIGFGWHERLDYVKWIRRVVEETGDDAQIVLHGVSMGGATVLMTSGEELPPQVKAIVSDCAYTSVAAELSYQLKRMYRLPAFPFLQAASLVSRIKAGYSFREASALRQVRRSKVPILFIHGDADTFVPYFMLDQLYEASRGPKERMAVRGAGHGLAYGTDKAGYIGQVGEFVARYTKQSP